MKYKKRNQAIDVVRIIACFLVIFAHIRLPGEYAKYTISLLRFAVPYFMIISGWYLYKENKNDALITAKKTFLKLLKFTFFSILFIAIINTIVCLIKNKYLFDWFSLFSRKKILFEFVVYNRAIFLSSIAWYLLAMIYVLIIYILLVKCDLLKKSFALIIPLILANLIINYCFDIDWYISGNWFLTGIPFVLLGSYLKSSCWWKKTPKYISIISIIIGFLISFVDAKLFPEEFLYINSILITFGIVTLVFNDNDFSCPKIISDFGQKCTPYIFVMHCSIRDLLYAIFDKPSSFLIKFSMPVIIFIISAIISIILVYIKNKACLLKNK